MSAICPTKNSGENSAKAQSPLTLGSAVDSPSRATIQSTTKSWCSSPFSNLDALSPEGNSLSFSLADFSPTISFSSPRLKFQEQASPGSASNRQKDHYSSIFSPSLFSPFNKSLKPHKMDKMMDGDYLDSELPHGSPSKGILASPDEHALLGGALRGYNTSDIHCVNFGGAGRLKDEDEGGGCVDDSGFDDSVLGDDLSFRFGDSPATSSGGSLLGLISGSHPSSGNGVRRSHAGQFSPSIKPLLGGDKSHSSSSIGIVHSQFKGSKGSTPLPPPPNPQSSSSSSSLLPKTNSITSSTPSAKNVPFSSPAVLAKAKQSNISPTVARGTCNCKKSKCLKLYCECFAALRYCDSCNCVECNNCKEHEDMRQEAIQVTKERNPTAFQLKVSVKKGHMAGCNCKKSQCLKKYCECFEGSVFCGGNCKCKSCENYGGSEKLKEAKSINREKRDRLPAHRPAEEGTTTTTTFAKPSVPSSWTPTGVASSPLSAVTQSPPSSTITAPSSAGTSTTTPFKVRSRRYASPSSSSVYSNGSNSGIKLAGGRVAVVSGGGVHWALGDCSSSTSSSSPSYSEHSQSQSSPSPDAEEVEDSENGAHPMKKRRVDVQQQQPISEYPFFGPKCPRTTKLTTLQCLEFLDGPNLFAVSLVSRLMNQAAMDDALWE